MRGLRLKGGIRQIEKRCKHAEGGWLRESTGRTGRAEAEQILIRRLAELEEEARREARGIYTFEEAAMRYREDIAHKSSAVTAAMHLDQLLPTLGPLPLEQVHDDTLKAFIDGESARGMVPKTINNAIVVVSAVLNRGARVWRTEAGAPWPRQARNNAAPSGMKFPAYPAPSSFARIRRSSAITRWQLAVLNIAMRQGKYAVICRIRYR